MEISYFNIEDAHRALLPLKTDAHKGTQGHSLIIGGSLGKIGAMILAGQGALRSGCGLVTAMVPRCGYLAVQSSIPEAMTLISGEDHLHSFKNNIRATAIGIGPGMGKENVVVSALKDFVKHPGAPLVLDADALNILAMHPQLLDALPPNTILTPHPGEFRRLFQIEPSLEAAARLASKLNIIIVLKGAPTHVLTPSRCLANTTGNPGLATGGSGDVLTGIITGLLAQGHYPADAASVGVFVHGLAADIGVRQAGARSFVSGDISRYLGSAFRLID